MIVQKSELSPFAHHADSATKIAARSDATNVGPGLTINTYQRGASAMILPTAISASAQYVPLPDYRLLFRLHAWLTNTTTDWAFDLSEPPEALTDADDALSHLVELACAREGKTYEEMLLAIHAGEFDRD
jgi:hypothetical protein